MTRECSLRPPVEALSWVGDARTGHLRLLDQTRLPNEVAHIDCRDIETLRDCIIRLSVRGAPAIGIAAAYGCVIGARTDAHDPRRALLDAADRLASSRPTAVNLFWALERMKKTAASFSPGGTDLPPVDFLTFLLAEASAIHDEDRAACLAIGTHALTLLRTLTSDSLSILTHCNAGALATGGVGTATAPIYLAHSLGLPIRVYADETRPLLQGARLTAWELMHAGIDVTLITDSMAGSLMQSKRVSAIITGADRIAANGDVANKIGTYPLAILARHHRLPFLVAAPTSTIDLNTPTGSDIPIEQRSPDEITRPLGSSSASSANTSQSAQASTLSIAPANVATWSPAFDVTPADLITAIITEKGVIRPVNSDTMRVSLDNEGSQLPGPSEED